jgi:hypothetical protein
MHARVLSAIVLLGLALPGGEITLSGRPVVHRSAVHHPPAAARMSPSSLQIYEQWALADLADLKHTLPWHPILPGSLPRGFRYFRIDQTYPNRYGFSIEIYGPQNQTLRVQEAPYQAPTAATKPDPMVVFRRQLSAVALANGTWLAQEFPGPGQWILMRTWGGLRIYVDGNGNVPKDTLEEFAGTLQ